MTRHIGGEFGGHTQLLAQFLQVMIDEVYPVLILMFLVNAGTSDEGEEIGGVVFMIFIHQFLHTGYPMDSDLLSRLLTKIDKIVALQVGLLQIGDVYQRHATGVETKEEDVARQGSEGIRGQFGSLYLLQLLGIDSALHGFGYAV